MTGGGEIATPARTSGIDSQAAVLSAPIRADTSLDKFLHKHTSEDNASYKEIADEEAAKEEERASHLYAPSLEYNPVLAIGCKYSYSVTLRLSKSPDIINNITDHEKGEMNQPPEGWNFKCRNDLIFGPQALQIKDKDNPNANRQITHPNTRYPPPLNFV